MDNQTTAASLRFPDTPVVSFCHGWLPWEELPARLPTVARYVAVDRACHDRLVDECGIPPEAVRVLHNFVDLRRFAPRGPLPDSPRRALVLSNAASERTHLPAVREACRRRGIALDCAGLATRPLERPEEVLGGYDLVFAKARAAMEAMATGCAGSAASGGSTVSCMSSPPGRVPVSGLQVGSGLRLLRDLTWELPGRQSV